LQQPRLGPSCLGRAICVWVLSSHSLHDGIGVCTLVEANKPHAKQIANTYVDEHDQTSCRRALARTSRATLLEVAHTTEPTKNVAMATSSTGFLSQISGSLAHTGAAAAVASRYADPI
jgi:hypothetical protein